MLRNLSVIQLARGPKLGFSDSEVHVRCLLFVHNPVLFSFKVRRGKATSSIEFYFCLMPYVHSRPAGTLCYYFPYSATQVSGTVPL